MKKKVKVDPLAKLVNLTKLINDDKVKIEPKGIMKGPNKWRSQQPKFAPKTEKLEKAADLVEAGGMQVDPSLKEAYENWRKDKIAEQEDRRAQALRKAEAAKRARMPPASSQ
jgi:hypothetical protein